MNNAYCVQLHCGVLCRAIDVHGYLLLQKIASSWYAFEFMCPLFIVFPFSSLLSASQSSIFAVEISLVFSRHTSFCCQLGVWSAGFSGSSQSKIHLSPGIAQDPLRWVCEVEWIISIDKAQTLSSGSREGYHSQFGPMVGEQCWDSC